MVYLSNATAKASTNGARLVWIVDAATTASLASLLGSLSSSSISRVERPWSSEDEPRARLDDGELVNGAGRFLGFETLLAALSICFATFSSAKTFEMPAMSDLAIFSGLPDSAQATHQRTKTLSLP